MITYQSDLWRTASWRRGDRYYHCELKQNLFADWVVVRSWGTVGTRRGRQMESYCHSFEDAEAVFQTVIKRRKYRGYLLVNN